MGFLNPKPFIVALAFVLVNSGRPYGDTGSVVKTIPLEYQVKSAFVFNFARFVTWPEGTFAAPDSPIIVGVMGRGDFVDALIHTIHGKTVEGHPLEVKKIDSVDAAAHILVLAKSEASAFPKLLKSVEGKPVLTVSDGASFLKQGGMVQLSVYDDQVRFAINLAPIERSGLTASSQMLQYANRVR